MGSAWDQNGDQGSRKLERDDLNERPKEPVFRAFLQLTISNELRPGLPYKQGVGGSSPSTPTISQVPKSLVQQGIFALIGQYGGGS
ncbi:hypothetical protein SAMN05421799_1065 [Alicyclobacillus vulcanalis]|uniref:Uncharacterized protein n=1 Tax=Alicyclobacillus vulcanalis TaxID=252246 RepID=A0A1N7MP44_9BACL|nr:hypothetical protein SAMN05421799_1065 [Alicyclobacillus vulcanalis]